jgi:hypothetical protein
VTNLNVAEEKFATVNSKGDVQGQISLINALKFNGGGKLKMFLS